MKYYICYQVKGELQLRGHTFHVNELETDRDGCISVYDLEKKIAQEDDLVMEQIVVVSISKLA